MIRLLNANFARLFKSRLFWICAAVSLAFALIEAIKCMTESSLLFPHPEESLFKSSGILLLFCETVLVGIFVGVEHGGALRNKIISGKSRTEIFLANTITCSAAAAMLQFIFVSATILAGLIFGGKFVLTFGEIVLYELLQLASLVQMSVITSTLSLLFQQKFSGTLWSIVLILILWVIGSVVSSKVGSLKHSAEYIHHNSIMIQIERTDITEEERLQISVLESVQDILPSEQQTQIKDSFYNAFGHETYSVPPHTSDMHKELFGDVTYTKIPIPVEIAPYSLGMIAVTTAVGALIFRKKDIK